MPLAPPRGLKAARQARSLWRYLNVFLTLLVLPCLGIQVAQAQAPSAPTGLGAIPSHGHVNLYWSSVSGATSYTLYRGTGAGSTPTSYKAGLTANSYADSALTDGTTYTYSVTATNTSGEGSPSNTVTATPGAAPSAPTNLSTFANSSTITLSWTGVSGCTYNIYRNTSGTSPLAPYATGITATSYTDTGVSGSGVYAYWWLPSPTRLARKARIPATPATL
jgi:cellulose 1,4-beta-cellobiosidase